MKKYQVFISYKSEQLEIANQFHNELLNHQITNWFDKDHLYKEVSKEYTDSIHQAIEDSELFLLLYSKEVNQSSFIINEELKYALDHQIPVFCFFLDDSEMCPEIKQMIQNKQWMYNFQDIEKLSAIKESVKDEEHRKFLQSLIDDRITPSAYGNNYNDINLFLMRVAIQRFLKIPTPFGLYRQLEQSGDIYTAEEIDIKVVNQSLLWPIPQKQRERLEELGFFKSDAPLTDVENIVANYSSSELIEQLKVFIRQNYPDIEDIDAYLKDAAEVTAERFISEIEQKGKRFNGAMLGVKDMRSQRTPNEERHLLYVDMYVSDYFTFKMMVELYHRLRTKANKFDIKNIEQISYYAPFLCSLGMGGYVVVHQGDKKHLMWTKRDETISSGNMWHFSFDETVSLKKDVKRDENDKIILVDGTMRISPYLNFFRGIKEENGIPRKVLKSEGGVFEIGIIMSERLEIEFLSYAVVEIDTAHSMEEQMYKYTENARDGKFEISKIKYVPLEKCQAEFVGHLITPESYALFQRLDMRFNEGDKYCPKHFIDPTSEISPQAFLGNNVLIESNCHVLAGAQIGDNCKIHHNVFVDDNVKIGNNVKIQNNNSIYHGVTLDDGVFIGPHVTFTNDKFPRSITADGKLKSSTDWSVSETYIGKGASLGGGSTIVCGVTIRQWAMIGAGSVVSKDIPEYALAYGCPAEVTGWVSKSGHKLTFAYYEEGYAVLRRGNEEVRIKKEVYDKYPLTKSSKQTDDDKLKKAEEWVTHECPQSLWKQLMPTIRNIVGIEAFITLIAVVSMLFLENYVFLIPLVTLLAIWFIITLCIGFKIINQTMKNHSANEKEYREFKHSWLEKKCKFLPNP